MNFAHGSVADIPEGQLVERLLSDPLWRYGFFELVGMPRDMANRPSILLDTVPGNWKGHIDALLCAPNHPGHAVAFQVKEIKFGIGQLRKGCPTKLGEYQKLARQANLLARIGFWQVYAYVLVVVDAREQNFGMNTYAGLSSGLKSLVNSTVSLEPLHERVGLGILNFTQPMDRNHLPSELKALSFDAFRRQQSRVTISRNGWPASFVRCQRLRPRLEPA